MLATGYLIREQTKLTPEGVEETEDYAGLDVLEGVPTKELDAAKRYCARVRRPRATKNTRVRRACATKPKGHAPEVWAVVTTSTYLPGDQDGPQTLTLEHYDSSGVRARTSSSGWGALVGLFDFDGNGSMELLTASSKSTDMAGGSVQTVKIWTVKGRQVTLYEDTKSWAIKNVVDADLDHWPDLVIDPYGITYGTFGGWAEGRPEWSILAHGTRDGRFSLDDEAAKAYARVLCCKRPTAVCTERSNCSAAAVHCARLWGAEPRKLKQDIAQLCAKPSDDLYDPCQTHQPLQQMANTALPPGLRLGTP